MSIDYYKIKEVMDADVPTFGGLDDAAAAAKFNLSDISTTRDSLSGSEIFGATDETEYNALATDDIRTRWLTLCGIDTITKDATPLIKSIFNNGTTTWTNIVAAATITESIADQSSLPHIEVGYITRARSL